MTTTTSIKPASLGSISHGTLRPEDLLSMFISELEWHILNNGNFFCLPENRQQRDSLNNIVGDAQDCFAEDGESIKEDEAHYSIENLTEALGLFAKPYCYFGAHYGDGSDFGFWPSHDSIDELPTVEGSDEAKELGEDCKSVNCHGNVTVYNGNGEAILEIV